MTITTTDLILYVLVGAVGGMIYGLRRVLSMENKIANLEKTIINKLLKKKR